MAIAIALEASFFSEIFAHFYQDYFLIIQQYDAKCYKENKLSSENMEDSNSFFKNIEQNNVNL